MAQKHLRVILCMINVWQVNFFVLLISGENLNYSGTGRSSHHQLKYKSPSYVQTQIELLIGRSFWMKKLIELPWLSLAFLDRKIDRLVNSRIVLYKLISLKSLKVSHCKVCIIYFKRYTSKIQNNLRSH